MANLGATATGYGGNVITNNLSTVSGTLVEIGTSAGYSTLWLALACRKAGTNVVTFELLEDKARLARETFDEAGVLDVVELVVGDARHRLSDYKDVAFCFLDAEKEHYLDCFAAVAPNLVDGGLLVADNVISHRAELEPFISAVQNDPRFESTILPIGKGELLCRKLP